MNSLYTQFPPKTRLGAMLAYDNLPECKRRIYEDAVKDFVYRKCQGNRALVIAKVWEGLSLAKQGQIPMFLVYRLWREIDYEVVGADTEGILIGA